MSKYVVIMNRECDFCQGINGFCDKAETRGQSCAGLLDNRPSWCVLTEVNQTPFNYMLTRKMRYQEKRIYTEC